MTPPLPDDAQVIVVGAGAVGLTLAITLARAGVKVLVVEAGPATPPADYRRFNKGRSVGRPHRGLAAGRMRALGGTTRVWGGQLAAFDREDIDGATPDGASPWPVRWAEIAPFIDAAYGFLGIDGAGADREAIWRRATGQPSIFGNQLRLGMNIWLQQPDFTRLFAADLASLPSLRITTDCPVRRLVFAAAGHVAGVELGRADAPTIELHADRVVLAAGTFENARLMLRAAATEPSCGFADNGHIGGGYIDHLHGIAGKIIVRDRRRLGALFDNIYFQRRKYSVKIRATGAGRRERGLVSCAATINTAANVGTLVRDLGALVRRLGPGNGAASWAEAARRSGALARLLLPVAVRYVWQRRSTSLLAGEVSLGVEIEQVATPMSCLFLDPDAPPLDAEICLRWAVDGREIEAVALFCEALTAQFEREGLGDIRLDERIVARDPAFLLSCHDSNHQMGGCRMAVSADEGVVDRDARVFGVDNLYIAGASIFPTGSFANPTLTAIAFALRLADHLVAGLRPARERRA